MYKSWPPLENTLESIKSPYHVTHPLSPRETSALAYALHEQFLKHSDSHSFSPVTPLSTRAVLVFGTFASGTFLKPSPLPHTCPPCFLTHPPDPSLMCQSRADLGSNPGRHVHLNWPMATLDGSQLPFGPQ
ncbi:hypothetical protein RHGRI_037395 [Rhododendron griersonianum]|uniref:Uncharacterized protein n=1 Tax=Rhododendron griersonianum TaxID=479676 RepID=A0AAV6HRK8_9ERIC|nr:hypothetical protein RHGRI_037395 [Rhododendron griersonianum]